MNEVVDILSVVLKEDKETIQNKVFGEEKDQDYINSLNEKVKGLKVLSREEEQNLLNNYKNTIKDSLYKEHKGTVLEMTERKLKEKYGVEGEYSNIDELVNLIVDSRQDGSPDDKLKADYEDLKKNFNAFKEEKDSELSTLRSSYEQRELQSIVSNEINKIAPNVDADKDQVNEQLEYLAYKFAKSYKVSKNTDGTVVVLDTEGNKVINEDHSYKTVEEVVAGLADASLKLKKVVPIGGRGDGADKKPTSKLDLKAYKTIDDLLNSEHGKGIQPGSEESIQLVTKWKSAQ